MYDHLIRSPSIPEIKYIYLFNVTFVTPYIYKPSQLFKNKEHPVPHFLLKCYALHIIIKIYVKLPPPPLSTTLHKILLNSLSIPHTSSSFHLSLPPPLSHFLFVLHSLTPTPSLSLCLIEGITRALMP